MDVLNDQVFRIKRILEDAGCGGGLIEKFLELEKLNKRNEQYRLLKRHKAMLLQTLHTQQYKIDCLDHMLYAMRKEDDLRRMKNERKT